jgi:hypothetical protein
VSDRDDETVTLPRWAVSVLRDELIGALENESGCGGKDAEPLCPICRALALAKEACDE